MEEWLLSDPAFHNKPGHIFPFPPLSPSTPYSTPPILNPDQDNTLSQLPPPQTNQRMS